MSASEQGRAVLVWALLIGIIGALGYLLMQGSTPAPRSVAPKAPVNKTPTGKHAAGVEGRTHDPAADARGEDTGIGPDDPVLRELKKAQPEDLRYFNLSKAQLVKMAEDCDVRSDVPESPTDEQVAEMGMTDQERRAYDDVLTTVQADHRKRLEALFVDAGGEPEWMEDMHTDKLSGEVLKMVRSFADVGRKELAAERAGLAEPPRDPASLNPRERWFRVQHARGDALEDALGRRIGRKRAHQLRTKLDGWPGTRLRFWDCPKR